MLEVEIRKRRRGMVVEAAFAVESGGALGVFGPSGAGKSTLLACIAGVQTPDEGRVRFAGRQLFPPPMPLHLRGVGYLTQEPNLFPHLSVAENVAFGLPRASARSEEQSTWLSRLRTQLHLEDCWQANAMRISAGQARRTALARMLARRPSLVLLDEPCAGLDRGLARGLVADLVNWRQTLGFTMIAVDHDADLLGRLAPRALVLVEGKVAAEGTWEELVKTEDPRLRRMMER